MSTRFTISSPVADFAWCTAQVQAINDIGRSSFSNLTNIVVPSRAPEQPRCFLVDDLGMSLNIKLLCSIRNLEIQKEIVVKILDMCISTQEMAL